MQHFTVDARDGIGSSACDTCCCEQVSARAGETNKWTLNYAPWSAPIGGKGLNRVSFEVEKVEGCETLSSNAPTNTNYDFTVDTSASLSENVSSGAADPVGSGLTYDHMVLFGPNNGTLDFNDDGTFTYTPNTGYTGFDKFYFTTENDIGQVANEVCISVTSPAVTLPAAPSSPIITPIEKSVNINAKIHQITFPLAISPIANVGDVYRLKVLTTTLDCECACYTHMSCYDIVISGC